MITPLLLCATALAGDLWLDIDASDADGTLRVHVPANDLTEEASTVRIQGAEVDLAAEAKALKAKGKGTKTFDLTEPDGTPTTMTLAMVEAADEVEPVTQVNVRIAGPLGMGMDFQVPLDGSQDLGEVNGKLGGAVDVEGVDLSLSDDDLAVLRRSGPTTLVQILGPKGGGLTISTK